MVAIEENVQECQIIQKIILANKTDMAGARQISHERGISLAESFKVPHFEVSAKTGENVTGAFEKLAQMLLDSQKPALVQRPDSIYLAPEISVETKKKKKCC